MADAIITTFNTNLNSILKVLKLKATNPIDRDIAARIEKKISLVRSVGGRGILLQEAAGEISKYADKVMATTPEFEKFCLEFKLPAATNVSADNQFMLPLIDSIKGYITTMTDDEKESVHEMIQNLCIACAEYQLLTGAYTE